MTVHGDNYVLDSGRSGHARLRVISEIHDERTRALLLGAGLEAGDRYVEFGCGLGYVTRWATSIGADALGIDLSADQIAEATELAEGKTEFRVGSVYDHGLPPESVDVSYIKRRSHIPGSVVASSRLGVDGRSLEERVAELEAPFEEARRRARRRRQRNTAFVLLAVLAGLAAAYAGGNGVREGAAGSGTSSPRPTATPQNIGRWTVPYGPASGADTVVIDPRNPANV